jgi:MFS family permease
LVLCGGLIGGMIGPGIGAALANLLPSYRDMYWCSAVMSGLSGLFALALARERFEAPRAPFELHLVQDFKQIVRLPNAIVLFLAFVVYTLTFNGSVPIISVYVINLVHRTGGADSDAPFWLGVVSIALPIGSALAAQIWGRLLDRIGPETVLTLGLLAGAASLVPVVLAASPLQLAGARLLLGMGSIGIGPAGISMLKARAPEGMDSRVLAYLAACGMLGMGVGPFIAGQLGPLIGLSGYFGLNAAVLLAMAWAWWGSLRTTRRTADANVPG